MRTARIETKLERAVAKHGFLEIIDEVPSVAGELCVLDRRSGLCVVLESITQLRDLVTRGAEWYLESVHNGGKLKAGAK